MSNNDNNKPDDLEEKTKLYVRRYIADNITDISSQIGDAVVGDVKDKVKHEVSKIPTSTHNTIISKLARQLDNKPLLKTVILIVFVGLVVMIVTNIIGYRLQGENIQKISEQNNRIISNLRSTQDYIIRMQR